MKPEYKKPFFDAANKFTCWIGLREPNPLAEQWIGRPGHIPKMMECKGKSADRSEFSFAGLVVDPHLVPEGFANAKCLAAAIKTWDEKFLRGGKLPPGFSVEQSGKERGLVKYHGSAIHADFDLMAILRSDLQGSFLKTSRLRQIVLYGLVKRFVNRGLRAPMIQHGAEFMWTGGVGAREFEYVIWFGPGKRCHRFPSSMPNGGH